MTVGFKGNTSIRETDRRGQKRGSQTTVTLTLKGLYEELLVVEPSMGEFWSEDSRFYVDSVDTVRTKGKLGETTVVFVTDSSLSYSELNLDVRIEIIWVRNDAPLIYQKQFRDDSSGAFTIDCMSLVEDYLQARTAAKRTTIKAMIDALGATATKYLELRVRGIDSILRFLPIVRKTTGSVLRPTAATNIGKRETPSVGSVAIPTQIDVGNPLDGASTMETLAWIKMRDDSTKTGRNKKWERTEEWHGFPPTEISAIMFK